MFNPGKPCCGDDGLKCGVPLFPGDTPNTWIYSPVASASVAGRGNVSLAFRYAPDGNRGYWRSSVVRFDSDHVVKVDRDGNPVSIGPGVSGFRIFFRGSSRNPLGYEAQLVYMTAFSPLDPATGEPWPNPTSISQGFLDVGSRYFRIDGPVVDGGDPFSFFGMKREYEPGADGPSFGVSASGLFVGTSFGSIAFNSALTRPVGSSINYGGTPRFLASSPPTVASSFGVSTQTADASECCRPWCQTCQCFLDYFATVDDGNGVWWLNRTNTQSGIAGGRNVYTGSGWKHTGLFYPDYPGSTKLFERFSNYDFNVYCCGDSIKLAVQYNLYEYGVGLGGQTIIYTRNMVPLYKQFVLTGDPGSGQMSLEPMDGVYTQNTYSPPSVRDACTNLVKLDVDAYNALYSNNQTFPHTMFVLDHDGGPNMPVTGGTVAIRTMDQRRVVCCRYPLPKKNLVLSWTHPEIGDGSVRLIYNGGDQIFTAGWVAESVVQTSVPFPAGTSCAGRPAGLKFILGCGGLGYQPHSTDGCFSTDTSSLLEFHPYPVATTSEDLLFWISSRPLVIEWQKYWRPELGTPVPSFFSQLGFTSLTITE